MYADKGWLFGGKIFLMRQDPFYEDASPGLTVLSNCRDWTTSTGCPKPASFPLQNTFPSCTAAISGGLGWTQCTCEMVALPQNSSK